MKLITKTDLSNYWLDENKLPIYTTEQFQNFFEKMEESNLKESDPKMYIEYRGIGRVVDTIHSFPVTLYELHIENHPSAFMIVKNN